MGRGLGVRGATSAFLPGRRWEMTTANVIPAGREGEGQQGMSRMFYLFV